MSPQNREKQHSRNVWERFWQQKRDISDVYSNSKRIVEQLQNTMPLENRWICEVGAGSGRDGLRLVDCGARVVLLDYAENSLRVMQRLARETGKTVYLVQGDAFHLPFRTESLDGVYHQGLLEHFADPSGILAENYRVIKKGGFALADVPQRYHLYTAVKHLLIRLNKWFAGWETEFSIRDLERLFRTAGFSIHHAYGDWMRPSFFYRSMRETGKKVGVHLPLYPPSIPGLRRLREQAGKKVKKMRPAFYTFMDIGLIGRK